MAASGQDAARSNGVAGERPEADNDIYEGLPKEFTANDKAASGGAGNGVDVPGAPVRDRFIPVTRHELIDRLTRPQVWPNGDAAEASKLLRFVGKWRGQEYSELLRRLDECYQPFSPDSDLLRTRQWPPEERRRMQNRLIRLTKVLLAQANFEPIDLRNMSLVLTKESHYGLDLKVEFDDFEELMMYYRGATMHTATRRSARKLYLYKEEFEYPVYQRLFILFKLKPFEQRVHDVMAKQRVERKEAEKIVTKLRRMLPDNVTSDNVYMKVFKNIPRTDLEMIFPNTRVQFRLLDKLKLGATAGGGTAVGVITTASKVAAAANPVVAAGALAGLTGIVFRQVMNYFHQHNRYMVTMAKNLYFHSLADNRAAMTLLADQALDEDSKEEMLLYAVLAKSEVRIDDLEAIDRAIEQYLRNAFGVDVNFDLTDALRRLKADGLVGEEADGTLKTLQPEAACQHLDKMWDVYLDHMIEREAERDRREDRIDDGPRA